MSKELKEEIQKRITFLQGHICRMKQTATRLRGEHKETYEYIDKKELELSRLKDRLSKVTD